MSLFLLMVPQVLAYTSGCRNTIKIVPLGSTHTGDPIITGNPANLIILNTGSGSIKNVWLLIVLNEETYNALDKILIDGSIFMEKSDFQLVTTSKIPLSNPNPATNYPGTNCQYTVSAIKDKMDEKGNNVYFGIKFKFNQITTTGTTFTIEVKLNSPANLKALILALGRYDCTPPSNVKCTQQQPFNACSSFSKSTLVVPEATTLALTVAPFVGTIGYYAIKRRYKR